MMLHDPATQSLVTDAQRDTAVKQLSRSYGEGAIDEAELDRRLGLALGARTRADLNQSLAGLVRIRPAGTELQPRIHTGSREPAGTQNENLGSGLVHLSGLAGFFLVPAMVKAVSQPGSRVWWEASRAMGFQLSTLVYGAATLAAAMILPGGGFWWTLFGLGWVAWFVLTLVGSAKAFSGQQSFPQLERYMVVKPKHPRR